MILSSDADATQRLGKRNPWVCWICQRKWQRESETNVGLSKEQWESNVRQRTEREIKSRWRLKRCENHKGKVRQGEKEVGWGIIKRWRCRWEWWVKRAGRKRKFCCKQRQGDRWWKNNDRGRSLPDLCWPLTGTGCWEELKEVGAAAVQLWRDILLPAS